ncbi:MAG TPA: polysaccharide biosynthesis protein [Pedobacter sp.]|jgi:O-antigen/teichoic acid export membrane protein
MKTAMGRKIYSNPAYLRIYEWGRLVSITGSAQIIIQVIGFVCGILIIRFLSTQEYALYTLANAMLGTMTVLTDGGISSGVMSEGGKVWTDRTKLGTVIATGLSLRRRFAAYSLLVAVPILFYMLYSHGASVIMSLLIVIALVPVFFASLSDIILEIPLKLSQAISPLQKNQLGSNIGRLALTGSTIFFFPFSFIALLAAGIPRIFANFYLYKSANEYADLTQSPDQVVESEMLVLVKRILPGAIYFSISGQLTIWLLSFFGSTAAVAQIGALGRLTMVLSLFSVIFSTLVLPRFARLVDDKKAILKKFLQVQFLLFVVNGLILGALMIFSKQFLSILGKDYSSLNTEILMMTISSCISMMAGITHSLSVSRGWALPAVINIGGNLATQILCISLLDMSNVRHVLLFSIYNSLVAFIMLIVYFLYRVVKKDNKKE